MVRIERLREMKPAFSAALNLKSAFLVSAVRLIMSPIWMKVDFIEKNFAWPAGQLFKLRQGIFGPYFAF